MDEVELQVHSALAHLHLPLADLFVRGVEFTREPTRPGQVHLIAHIGREISRSLLRIIASELPDNPTGLVEASSQSPDPARGGDMRAEIGRALGLSSDHPVVRAWYGAHRAFQRRAHVGESPEPLQADQAVLAFQQLTKFLHSRLAPYFTAEDATLVLLSRPPQQNDVEVLHAIFLRPQLRYRFFAECSRPDWLEFLDGGGFFVAPSMPTAGERRPTPWPEGTALVNAAAGSPELVTRILQDPRNGIARTNLNPIVWDQVSRTIENLPVTQMKRLVRLLLDALHIGSSRYSAVAALKVARALAEAGEEVSIDLARGMLGLRRLPEVAASERHRIYSTPTYQLLESVPDYYAERLLEDVVPVIAGHYPLGVASLLIDRLDRAEHLLSRAGYTDAGFAHHWLNRWDGSLPARDDLRADLARAIDSIAWPVLRAAPDRFTEWDALVDGRSSHVMKRLRLRFAIAAGTAGAAHVIHQTLMTDWVLDPDFGAREVAEILRSHFRTADSEARAVFVSRLEAGPDEERIRFYCELRGLDPDEHEARQACISSWQEQRLRWFHADLPEDLVPLAMRIGFTPEPVDRQRQDLDEVGHWSSGVSSAGDASPMSVEELRAMSDEAIVDFLAGWEPTKAQRFDGPNRQGLAGRLRQLVMEDLYQRGGLLQHLATHPDLDAGYRSAALSACSEILEEPPGDVFPWEEVLLLARVAIKANPDTDSTSGRRPRLWARREALRFLREVSNKPILPAIHAPTLIDLVGICVATAPRWAPLEDQEAGGFGSLGMIAMNHDAGVVVDLIVSACRFLKQLDDHTLAEVDTLVAGWLDEAVGWEGPNAAGARWQLGQHLPALLHFADSWVQANEVDLLGDGMTDPLSAPTWGAFLRSYGVHDNVFRRLGRWYRLHASQIRKLQEWEATTGSKRDDERISRHFAEHVGMALLRGLITFDSEEDEDLRQVLVQCSGDDRAHFAWLVMRALDDVDSPLQEGFTDRLIRYWAWRLDEIGNRKDPQDAKELDALGWFIRIERLDPGATIDLALRTIEGASATVDVRGHVWQALPRFVVLDPVKSVRMVEALVAATLVDEYAYIDFTEVAPVLTSILASGDTEARERAKGVINRLGEAGWSEFRQLLS